MTRQSHPHYDSPEDWATNLEQSLLHCRELGHSWNAYTASYDASEKVYDRVLLCGSCGTERHQVLDQFGEVLKNGYHYVEGYLAKGYLDHVGHKVPRSTFRLAALQRATNVTPIRRAKRKKAS